MVHSGYPLKHRPLRFVLGWCHPPCPLRLVLGWCTQWIWCTSSLNLRPLRLVLGWCTVGIILLNIVLLG